MTLPRTSLWSESHIKRRLPSRFSGFLKGKKPSAAVSTEYKAKNAFVAGCPSVALPYSTVLLTSAISEFINKYIYIHPWVPLLLIWDLGTWKCFSYPVFYIYTNHLHCALLNALTVVSIRQVPWGPIVWGSWIHLCGCCPSASSKLRSSDWGVTSETQSHLSIWGLFFCQRGTQDLHIDASSATIPVNIQRTKMETNELAERTLSTHWTYQLMLNYGNFIIWNELIRNMRLFFGSL